MRVYRADANSNTADSIEDGLITGYAPNSKYLVSYWVKGTADTRIYAKKYNTSKSAWDTDWKDKLNAPGNTWTLYTAEIDTDANGNAWWNVFVIGNAANVYACIDDVQFVLKDSASSNISNMVTSFTSLSYTSNDFARTKEDIKQWIAKGYSPDDASLKQYHIYFGDVNKDYLTDANDITAMRKSLLGIADSGCVYDDVNGTDDSNILDLVKLKNVHNSVNSIN